MTGHLSVSFPVFALLAFFVAGISFAFAQLAVYLGEPSSAEEDQIVCGLGFISASVIGAVIAQVFASLFGGFFVAGLFGFGLGQLSAIYLGVGAEHDCPEDSQEN